MTGHERHLIGVWRAGWKSFFEMKPRAVVPYSITMKPLERKAWTAGWDSASARARSERIDVV